MLENIGSLSLSTFQITRLHYSPFTLLLQPYYIFHSLDHVSSEIILFHSHSILDRKKRYQHKEYKYDNFQIILGSVLELIYIESFP